MKNAKTRVCIDLLSLIFVTFFIVAPVWAGDNIKLEIVYPKEKAVEINASSTFFIGNTDPEATLFINNRNVKVYSNGAFVHVVRLKPGSNTVSLLTLLGDKERRMEYTVKTPQPEKILPKSPMAIDASSITPGENVVFGIGETLNVSFTGSTGNKAYFSIGKRRQNIPMQEQLPPKGVYAGTYTFDADDGFENEPLILTMVSEQDKFRVKAPASISTLQPDQLPITARIVTDYATVRDDKNHDRMTPLPGDTLLSLTGKIGSNFRYEAGGLKGWINEEDVVILPPGSAPKEVFPVGSVDKIDFVAESDKILLKIPVSGRVPIFIEEPSESELSLKILGVVANSNLIQKEILEQDADKFLEEINWSQEADNVVQIDIKTSENHFWGYDYYYDDNTLVLKMRKPPHINAERPLKNITICIDPGHGGDEEGAIGPTGITEKDINLEISKLLRNKLVAKGANVIMTRTRDRETELYSRVDYAVKNDAVILLSIHNNALPDGKDPYKEHGTASYYYHPQSLPLAMTLQKALLEDLKFRDHGIYRESFVLTRPPQLLAVLLEIGFMIHPDEYQLLTQLSFQKKAASSIVRGLEFFLFQKAIEQEEQATSAATKPTN